MLFSPVKPFLNFNANSRFFTACFSGAIFTAVVFYLVHPITNHAVVLPDVALKSNIHLNTIITPVKLNFDSKDAVLNSDDHFIFDLDGFKKKTFPPIITTGGLNPNEGWLALDVNHDGFFKKIQGRYMLDGADIFGDHLGTYKSGYDNLAQTFAANLKTDPEGKRYIPLDEPTWWGKAWLWIERLFGFHKAWDPTYDLKLITRTQKVSLAARRLSRIYVDYRSVKEYDATHRNAIFQRAKAVYRDERQAQSADEWFQVIALIPIDKAKDLKTSKP